MTRNPSGRVLVLVPRGLGQQWTDRLKAVEASAMWADRRRILELAAAAQGTQPLWSGGTAVVMSIDLAKRPDVFTVLKGMEWDLLVADESHLLKGKRADAFFGLLEAGRAKRGLLLTSLPSTGLLPIGLPIAQRSFTWNDIRDWEGHPVVVMRQPFVRLVTYKRSPEETKLLGDLERLAAKVSKVVPALAGHAAMLVRTASSSLYAAERRAWQLGDTLKHIRNIVTHGRDMDMTTLSQAEDEVLSEEAAGGTRMSSLITPRAATDVAELAKAMEEIVERFGEIPSDAKADALRFLVNTERAKLGQRITHTCVWTGFAATAQYLTRVLEGGPVFRLAVAMELDARADIVARFRADGGILLTNGPAIEELKLPFVDTCMHYDLPVDPRSLEQRLGVFLRYGRTKAFESIALRDSTRGLAWEEALFQNLQAIIRTAPRPSTEEAGTHETQ